MYLAMGMTYSEYWEKTPYLAVSYRKAYELKTESKNRDAWWQGVYVHEAVASAILPKIKYPTRAHDISPVDQEDAAKREREKAKAQLNLRMMALKQKYGRIGKD